MPSQVVFIASLAHSGSTVTDLVLGAHSQVVGLGEVSLALRLVDQPQRVCTCGESAEDCTFWGRVIERVRLEHPDSENAYRIAMDVADDVFGSEVILVDSSKYVHPLQTALNVLGDRCRVLYLVRDVRGFASSRGRLPGYRGWRHAVERSFLVSAMRWYRDNRAMRSFIADHIRQWQQLGYEELCFRPEESLRRACELMEVDFEEQMLRPANSTSHIIRGNEMRYDGRALNAIRYDSRWMASSRIAMLQWLLAPVLRWNAEHVYGNLRVT